MAKIFFATLPSEVKVEQPPPDKKVSVKSVPDDLSNYVDFLHPSGKVWLNPVILIVMFLICVTVTARVLWKQDVA